MSDDEAKEFQQEMECENETEKMASQILEKFRAKLFEIGDPPYQKPEHYEEMKKEKLKEIKNAPTCAACTYPVCKEDFIVTMPCCGSWCHILCIANIAGSHKFYMNHACPKCTTPFDQDFEELIKKMGSIIRKPQKH